MKENNKDITYFVLGLIACLAMIVLSIMSIVTRIKSLKNNTYSNTNTSNVQNEILNPLFNSKDDEEGNVQTSKEINVLPTLLDKVSTNSAWCGTFQLVWNDMQNEVVGKDIEFDPQIAMVENLNKQSFKEKDISQDYYYKIWGLKTKKLKETIENGIKEKFNQKSDVIDLIDWDGVPLDDSSYTGNDKEYIFYAMLYRQFNFEKEFTVLNKADFNGTGKKYNDVEYFGIDNTTDETVYNQINALYYNSEEDFAVMLKTKEGDEVLLSKGKNGTTFEEIYNNVVKKSEAYEGNKAFTEDDTFKVPKVKFDVLKEFNELENKQFIGKNGSSFEIAKALQTIKFELNEKGGEIKSEAVIDMMENAALIDEELEHRYFNFDGTYTMFLRENGKSLPYFAVNIDDISLYQ